MRNNALITLLATCLTACGTSSTPNQVVALGPPPATPIAQVSETTEWASSYVAGTLKSIRHDNIEFIWEQMLPAGLEESRRYPTGTIDAAVKQMEPYLICSCIIDVEAVEAPPADDPNRAMMLSVDNGHWYKLTKSNCNGISSHDGIWWIGKKVPLQYMMSAPSDLEQVRSVMREHNEICGPGA